MKTYLIAPLLLLTIASFAQDIPKKSNIIKVETNLTADSLFTLCGNALLDAGYVITDKDRQFKTFSANLQPVKYTYTVQADVRIKDGVVMLTGKVQNMRMVFDAEALGGKNSVTFRAFNHLNDVAKTIPGRLVYEKRK